MIGRRAALNLTQEELAEAAGVSLRSVAAWEAGTQQPTLRMLHRLAGALQCPAAWLMGETDSAIPSSAEEAPRYRNRADRVISRMAELTDVEFNRIEAVFLGIIDAVKGGRTRQDGAAIKELADQIVAADIDRILGRRQPPPAPAPASASGDLTAAPDRPSTDRAPSVSETKQH